MTFDNYLREQDYNNIEYLGAGAEGYAFLVNENQVIKFWDIDDISSFDVWEAAFKDEQLGWGFVRIHGIQRLLIEGTPWNATFVDYAPSISLESSDIGFVCLPPEYEELQIALRAQAVAGGTYNRTNNQNYDDILFSVEALSKRFGYWAKDMCPELGKKDERLYIIDAI